MADDNTSNWIKEVYTDRVSKIIARFILLILAIIVVIAAFFHFTRISNLQHSKLLWGLDESNIPKGYPDTVYVKEVSYVHDTVRTILNLKPEKILTAKKTNLQKVDSGGSGIQNNGVNNGNQAGRDLNINNYYGGVQLHPDASVVNKIKKDYPDVNAPILFGVENSTSSKRYVIELINLLKQDGYKKVGYMALSIDDVLDKGVYPQKIFGQNLIIVQME